MGRKKKTVVEKIADAVEKVIHPEAPKAEEPQKSEPAAEKPKSPYQDHMAKWESKAEKAKEKKSSQADLDYYSHPKFHKFKGNIQGEQ